MSVHKFTDGRKGWFFTTRINGKQYKREGWNGEKLTTKTAALQAEFEFKEYIKKGLDPAALSSKKLRSELDQAVLSLNLDSRMTLYNLFDDYVTNTKANLKVSSRHNYSKFRRNELTLIEDKPLTELTPKDFLQWRSAIAVQPITILYKRKIINIMIQVLNYGSVIYNLPGNLQYSLLERLNEDNNVIEILNKKEKFLPEQEFNKLVSQLDKEDDTQFYYFTILIILYYTGLRIGELAALQVKDFKDGYLVINKDYIRIEGVDYIQPPKNKNSIRKVLLDSKTNDLLLKYIRKYSLEPNDILFHRVSPYLNQQKLRRVINNLSKSAGLDEYYEITPHTLRHSHNSNLRELGFDEYTRAQRLGNTPSVNANIYTHANANEQFEIAKKLRKTN